MKFTADQKKILAATLLAEFDKGDQALFVQFCERAGLDPFRKQVYALPRQGKMSIVTSIDGLRAIAQRSGEYEGQTAPQWMDGSGKWHEVWLSSSPPVACKIGVHRKNFREPLYAICTMNEHGGVGGKWKSSAAHMLAKTTEALALRKAFPNETGGVISEDEVLGQPEDATSDAPKNDAKSRADVIKTQIAGVSSGSTLEVEYEPFDSEDGQWLNDSLETVGASLDSLRVAMSGGKDIDKSMIPMDPEGNWPKSWKGRIDKWLKMQMEEASDE